MRLVKIATVVVGLAYMVFRIGPMMGFSTEFWIATGTLTLAIYGLVTILNELAAYAWKQRRK